MSQTHVLPNTEQHRLRKLYPEPDFVKKASHHQLTGEDEQLPNHVYAIPAKRQLPVHTKAATWMTALCFPSAAKEFSKAAATAAEQRIKQAATYWGISRQVNELWEKMASDKRRTLNDLPDDDFALVWTAGDYSERHYPLRGPAEVKQAAAWFEQNADEFTFDDKHQMARKILVKAAAYGVDLDDAELLNKCAGFGAAPPAMLANAWSIRAAATRVSHPELSQMAEKVASATVTADPLPHDGRVEMASALDMFDRETNLVGQYGNGLYSAEDTVFALTEKSASEFVSSHVPLATGNIYQKSAIAQIPMSTIRDWMGSDIADELGGIMLDIEKMAELLPTLPRPEAGMFDEMASTLGIAPVVKEKVAAWGMPDDEREALAAIYSSA